MHGELSLHDGELTKYSS